MCPSLESLSSPVFTFLESLPFPFWNPCPSLLGIPIIPLKKGRLLEITGHALRQSLHDEILTVVGLTSEFLRQLHWRATWNVPLLTSRSTRETIGKPYLLGSTFREGSVWLFRIRFPFRLS